jgi:hypothetical protein
MGREKCRVNGNERGVSHNEKREIPEPLSSNLHGLLGSKDLMHKGRLRLLTAGKVRACRGKREKETNKRTRVNA